LKQGTLFSHRAISQSVLHSILKHESVLVRMNPAFRHTVPSRGYAMVVARILRGALKIRYLILGGALGGGMTLQKVIYIYSILQPLFKICSSHGIEDSCCSFLERRLLCDTVVSLCSDSVLLRIILL
jgi:hypothetical protein